MARLTIDELAREAGITTRNIRAYQERGLLPPPARVGRTGYYDERHLARLKVIAELLGRGYSLTSIGELLDAWEQGGDLGQHLGFERALTEPWSDEAPVHLTAAELAKRFPADDPDGLRRAVELGLLELEGDGFRVPSMELLEAGAELYATGVPLDAVLDEAAALQADTERIATRYVELFLRYVWEPFVAAGMPQDDLPRITEAVERLRPLAARTVLPALNQAMEAAVTEATAATITSLLPRRDEEAS